VSTTTPNAMPASGLAATRGNDEASTLFTVMMFVGSALLAVLLTMLVLYRRGRYRTSMVRKTTSNPEPTNIITVKSGVDAGRPLPITNSNETALVLRSVMSSVQRLVDQNRRYRLENVRACPLPSPRHWATLVVTTAPRPRAVEGGCGRKGTQRRFEHRCEMGLISPV
jgi:hypothetical protein